MTPNEDIKPQPGYQMQFLSSPADVVIGGGAGFAGKSFALLMDAARGVMSIDGKPVYPGYGAVIFRHSYPEIVIPGGLWDDSTRIYPHVGGRPSETKHSWYFEDSQSEIVFKHLARETELEENKGQIAYIGWDEMTDFTQRMFTYMLSRNRSTSGFRPKTRGTCNPDPDSWLADFLAWWINQETGFPIKERGGKIRYFTVDQDRFVWGDTRKDVYDKTRHIFDKPEFEGFELKDMIKSATFIPGNFRDNKIGIKENPSHIANLAAQSEEEKLRLLEGNWKIRVDGSSLFDWAKMDDLFSNIIPESPRDKYYISIDHAWAGKDLCIIGTWKGWKCIRIDIIPKGNDKWRNDLIVFVVNANRSRYRPLPVSNIMIDQDGVGVRDVLRCNIFQGHLPPTEKAVPPPHKMGDYDVHTTPRTYKNKKTQCAYKLADKVNGAMMSVDLNNVWIWEGNEPKHCSTGTFMQDGKLHELRRRIKEEFRTVKREKQDYEGRKEITPKDKQKNALGSLSPDFFDMCNIRAEFEFLPVSVGFRN